MALGFKRAEKAARFTSKEVAAVEQVTAKLEAARTTLANAEAALRDAALSIALAEDSEAAGAPYHVRITKARDAVALLERAQELAEAAERARQARVAQEHRAAQNRAIRQHEARLVKAARAFETAEAARVAAFDQMVEIGQQIQRLLPEGHDGFGRAVSYRSLHDRCMMEMARVGRGVMGDPAARLAAPGTASASTFYPKTTPPLGDALEAQLGRLHAQLTGEVAPPAAVPAPPAAPAPTAPEPQTGGNAPSSEEPSVEATEEPRQEIGLSHQPEPELSESARSWLAEHVGKLPGRPVANTMEELANG